MVEFNGVHWILGDDVISVIKLLAKLIKTLFTRSEFIASQVCIF